MAESKDKNAQFYLLRNTDVGDENGYMKKLEGREIEFFIDLYKKYAIIDFAITIGGFEPCQDRKVAALRMSVYV